MKGIQFDQVAAVADAMVGEGLTPSIRTIRERLGSGSSSTIHKHLTAWADSVQKPAASALTLSQTLTNAIIAELARNAAEARGSIESKLIEAQAAAAELAQAGELLESERDMLAEKVTDLTRERDNIAGKSAQQEIDLALQAERIEREQGAAESARVELAKEKLKSENIQNRDAEQVKEIERKSAALDLECKARIAAEQLAAVLGAKHEGIVGQAAKAEVRMDLLSKQLSDAANELHSVRIQAQAQQAEHSAVAREQQEALRQAQRASTEALLQAQRTTAEAQEAINAAKRADREAAELRGRLAAMQELVKDAQAAG